MVNKHIRKIKLSPCEIVYEQHILSLQDLCLPISMALKIGHNRDVSVF